MSFKRNKLRDAITFALVVGSASAFGAGAAFAQETPAAETTPTEIDTINVTGTRIQSQTVTASSPVVEIQPEEFQYAGATRVDDLVNQYPQMSPYFDSFANNQKHKAEMEKHPDMGHDEPNGVRLKPGARTELIWRFTKAGTFEFACLITGHYEAGMKGVIVVR